MSLWDVQRDTRDNRIIAIRPAGFKGWGKKDNLLPLSIKREELGNSYHDLDAVACDKGGDGISLTRKQVMAELSLKVEPVEGQEGELSSFAAARLQEELARRGLPALIDEAAKEAGVIR